MLSSHLVSIAPMMGYTDRHYRKLIRLITRHTRLYTEMVTTGAILRGDRSHLLDFDKDEHPIALQLGGFEPTHLAQSARIGEDWGYDEINLNVGCPSEKVKSGRFGACLMKEPGLVAEGVAAMMATVKLPVTVKTRIGVDDQDSYADLFNFIKVVSETGCQTFILHARKAWLQGLSPHENRTLPPLQYDRVFQIKKDFPHLTIVMNGGIQSIDDISAQLAGVDGVMIGRAAYANPLLFSEVDSRYFNSNATSLTLNHILRQYLPYMAKKMQQGVKLNRMTRHLVKLFRFHPEARMWRRCLSQPHLTIGKLEEALLSFI